MSGRAEKPAATSADVKRILSRGTRALTAEERAERVDFYSENTRVQATAVEPRGNHGPARG